jgi:PAS domain S-box-containing protein
VGVLGVFWDITERKRAEIELQGAQETLRVGEAHYRTLIESLPQLVWTCRGDGPCDFLSKQWVEYTGVPEADQLGYGWLQQVHPDDRQRVIDEWSLVAPLGDPFNIEFRIRRNDGIYRWFKTRAVPLRDANGQLVKWFGSNTDIEDVKTRSSNSLPTWLPTTCRSHCGWSRASRSSWRSAMGTTWTRMPRSSSASRWMARTACSG